MSDEQAWNERYLKRDIPWDRDMHHSAVERMLSYVNQGDSVLEIGCGTGANARWLSDSGYKVTAIDISEEAIQLAKSKNTNINFLCMDILKDANKLSKYSAIFDCAVLPVLSKEKRIDFVAAVAKLCEKGGYWINVSCSKDGAENIEQETHVKAPPYLTAEKIIVLVEPLFEIIEMKRSEFMIERKESGKAIFNAWLSVFKKR